MTVDFAKSINAFLFKILAISRFIENLIPQNIKKVYLNGSI